MHRQHGYNAQYNPNFNRMNKKANKTPTNNAASSSSALSADNNKPLTYRKNSFNSLNNLQMAATSASYLSQNPHFNSNSATTTNNSPLNATNTTAPAATPSNPVDLEAQTSHTQSQPHYLNHQGPSQSYYKKVHYVPGPNANSNQLNKKNTFYNNSNSNSNANANANVNAGLNKINQNNQNYYYYNQTVNRFSNANKSKTYTNTNTNTNTNTGGGSSASNDLASMTNQLDSLDIDTHSSSSNEHSSMELNDKKNDTLVNVDESHASNSSSSSNSSSTSASGKAVPSYSTTAAAAVLSSKPVSSNLLGNLNITYNLKPRILLHGSK